MRMIASPFKGGTRSKPLWVVIHTAEGSRTVDSLGKWFQMAGTNASSHVGIDDNETVMYVPYAEQAWTARSANPMSDQAELCGFVKWSRAEWLTHKGMLDQTAAWIADRCKARGIPCVKLTSADVAARRPGVIGHINVTEGLKDGSHVDPGPNFPWDYVMSRAQQIVAGKTAEASEPAPEEDDMADPVIMQKIDEIHWMLEQIKPQADRLDEIQAAVDKLAWAVTDPEQGLRTQVAAVQTKLAQG